MDKKDLFIGLDVGTDSVGWAATDQDFNLRRLKGKTAWGARIFDEASDAKGRRAKRTARRRQQRRKYRIHLLNCLFDPLITPQDSTFFLRLANSNLWNEDKDEKARGQYPLFISKEEEKSFYKKYPTIWHLRKDLIENPESPAYDDLRKVYLAIHHIIKYRGNFLTSGEVETKTFDNSFVLDVNSFFKNYLEDQDEASEVDYCFMSEDKIPSFMEVLQNSNYNVRDRKAKIGELVDKSVDSLKGLVDLFVALVSGGSFNLSKVLESGESKEVRFDNSFDDNCEEIHSLMGENYALIVCAKRIFDYFKLKDLLRGNPSISSAFASVYDQHAQELKYLKKLCKRIDKDHHLENKDSLFYRLFKDPENENNYPAFVRVDSNKANTDPHALNSYVLKVLAPYSEELDADATFRQIKFLCERDQLLLTPANCSTSLVPHQLHEKELLTILDFAKKHHPEIAEIEKKIHSIFLFRVPYYFGPLNSQSRYSNVVRKSNEKAYPWNLSDIIDEEKTREKFMKGLTNSCTYLLGEKEVLPLQSIIYQKFNLLNRLNGVKINGSSISQEIKSDLYLFALKRKKTTINQIKNYLKKKYAVYQKDDIAISGLNEEDGFVSDSYVFFQGFYRKDELDFQELEEAEKIIFAFAIYSDNNRDAIQYIAKNLGRALTDNQLKMLRSKSFAGWGRLSKKLLTGLRHIDDNGEALSILDLLEQTTMNFQQILHAEQYGFLKRIEDENRAFFGDQTEEDKVNYILEAVPPKMRRSTIQAVRIVDEIVKFAKQEPKYIAIEVTRAEDEKKKGSMTVSRQKEVQTFVKALIKDSDELLKKQAKQLKEEYEELEKKNQLIKLNGEALYLYFKQDGIDLYTGKPIDINDVLNSDQYDCDHIVPQHLMKDDSLDNKVLTNRVFNQRVKGGAYPIPEAIRCNPDVVRIWKILKKKGSISDKKYNNLIRAKEMSDEELNDFVNAQINVVNYSNITIKEILEVKYPNTKLIFSKAKFPSLLRRELDIPKMRDLNDTHHAVDAYLNIVAGVTLYQEYSRDYLRNRKISDRTYNMGKRMLDLLRERDQAERIKLLSARHDFLLTYRLQRVDGAFYDETIYKKDGKNEGSALIPIHTSGPMACTGQYGGYQGLSVSYFLIARIQGRKDRRILFGVPVLWDVLYRQQSDLEKHCLSEIKAKKEETVSIDFKRKIYPNQKILIRGKAYLLCNSNKDVVVLKPISPVFLDSSDVSYLNGALKRLDAFKGFAENRFEMAIDRKEEHKFEVSKEKNAAIFKKLLKLSEDPGYDYCPMISGISRFKESFDDRSLHEQILLIQSILARFTRQYASAKIEKTDFRKSKSSLLEEKVVAVYDSVTGLESHKKPL